MFEVMYHQAVVKQDIPKLSPEWRGRIKTAIEAKLATAPDVYGKPLRRSLKSYHKLRVGNYRVIFRIQSHQVKIFAIQHRSKIYSVAVKRLH